MDLDAGGQLFDLGAGGELDGRWGFLPYEALGDIALTGHVQAGLDLTCHELGIELGAAAIAEGNLGLGALLRLDAAGQAAAAAGVSARVGFAMDVLDVVRVGAEAGAWAYVSASGHLALGVDVGQLVTLVEEAAGGAGTLPARLARIVLEEIELGVGAWGGVAAAAMAYGKATATFSLSDKGETEAGLTVQYEGALGAGAGGRVDIVVAGGFDDPRRLVGRLGRTSTRAFVNAVREALPAEAEPALRLTELILPTALALSYELGQQTFLNTVGAADARAKPVVLAIAEQLQRFTLDGLLEAADVAAAEIVDRIRFALEAGQFDDATGQALRAAVPAVRAIVARSEGTISADLRAEDLFTVATASLTALIDLFTPFLEEQTIADWGRPLAMMWSAATLIGTLGPGMAPTSAGATFLGFGPDVIGDRLGEPLPTPPQLVATEIGTVLGGTGTSLTAGDALAYLVAAAPGDLLSDVPGLDGFVDLCREHLGIDPATLMPTLLAAGFNDGPGQAAYAAVQALVDAAVAQYVTPMIDEARAAGGAGSDAAKWLDEVAEPAVVGVRDVLLARVRAFVDGEADAGSLQPLADAGGQLLYRLAVPAGALVADQVLAMALQQVSRGMAELAELLRDDSAGTVGDAFEDIVGAAFPLLSVFPNFPEATRDLAADLAEISALAWGPQVFTPQRRNRLRRAYQRALANPVGSTLDDAASWDAWLLDAADCEFVPAFDELTELGMAQLNLLAAWFGAVVVPTAEALARFTQRLGDDPVVLLEELVLRELQELADGISALASAAAEAAEALAVALDVAALALGAARDAAADVVEYVGSAAFAAEVLTRLDAIVDDPDDLVYLGLRGALETGWALLGLAADLLGATIRGSGDAAVLVLELAAAMTRVVADGLEWIAGVTDIEVRDAIAGAIVEAGPSEIGTALTTEAAAQDAERASGAAATAKLAARERHRDLRGTNRAVPAVRILDPLPADDPEAFWYGTVTPLHVEVDGAHPLWVTGAVRRIRLALNGEEFEVPAEDWVDTGEGLTLTTQLTAGLRLGINTVEVTAVTPRGVKRLTRPFLVDTATRRSRHVVVDPRRSVLTSRGTDAQRTPNEVLVLTVDGETLDFAGWRVFGRGGDRMKLKGTSAVGHKGRLYLHTGAPPANRPPDTPQEVHRWWGRQSALWNSRGDTVTVIDNRGTVRTVHTYDS